jgi:hypothetical protein
MISAQTCRLVRPLRSSESSSPHSSHLMSVPYIVGVPRPSASNGAGMTSKKSGMSPARYPARSLAMDSSRSR